MEAGRPNHGMISVTKIDVTVEDFLLIVGRASTHPVKVSTKYQEVLNPLYWRHVCEVHLTIHGREASPGLMGRKGRGSNIGVVVCVLAN
jgi:hypothetical protein